LVDSVFQKAKVSCFAYG